MIVIADTGPLNYLLRLKRVDLLQWIYGHVVVPDAVIKELRDERAPAIVRTWAAAPPRWLEIRSVQSVDRTLPSTLGAGELEAISLALELRADYLLIDELRGRQLAKARSVALAGTLAVLLQSALDGHLELAGELQRLRGLGFRMSEALENDTLALYDRLREQQPS